MKENKTAILITGAAGGLGSALVEMSKSLPDLHHVIAADIKERVSAMYKDDPKVIGIPMDVGSESSIRKAHEQLHKMDIQIKFLINCAGIAVFHPISESTEELLDKTLKVNTYGPVLTVSVFLNDLIETKGRVIQISSDSVRLPTLFHPYPNSKIALEAFSTSMRQELNLLGIDLIMIRPGAINTDLIQDVKSTKPLKNSPYESQFQNFLKLAKEDVGKMVEPKEVAQLINKVILAKNPKRNYSINKNRKISLLANFPQKWIDFFVKKATMK